MSKRAQSRRDSIALHPDDYGRAIASRNVTVSSLAPLCAAGLGLMAGVAQAATFTVSNLDDAGAGSLRQAIIDANSNANPGATDIINATELTGQITLASRMDVITEAVTINGPTDAILVIDGTAVDYPIQVNANATFNHLTVQNNNGLGSCIRVKNDADFTLNDSVVTGCSTEEYKSPYYYDPPYVTDSVFEGGGISNFASNGTVTINRSSLTGNYANWGGAISNRDGGPVSINDSTLSGNSSQYQGGALYANGNVTVSNSTISHNVTSGTGGGIINRWGDNDLTVTGSAFIGNTARWGGAIGNFGFLLLSNSTLSGNTAERGGGLYNSANYGSQIIHTTIVNNVATYQGGGIRNGNSISFTNTLIANNTAPDGGGGDCRADASYVQVLGSNLDSDGSCVTTFAGFTTAGVPGLLPLADNAGPTQTHKLTSDSSAVNTGNTLCADDPTNQLDQRGYVRADGSCDAGAFERGALPPRRPPGCPEAPSNMCKPFDEGSLSIRDSGKGKLDSVHAIASDSDRNLNPSFWGKPHEHTGVSFCGWANSAPLFQLDVYGGEGWEVNKASDVYQWSRTSGNADGVRSSELGYRANSHFEVRASGGKLMAPTLPTEGEIKVQVHISDGHCGHIRFRRGDISENDGKVFEASKGPAS